ncbi:hypothetical protein [Paenibacillus puerhi]|uniref:hypothetical protein n=1 Tax=Paenibacillus puerhi TaxID=2692622 RepID=UPI001F32F9B8|nr:hypothetical protein [Paenibacillus puerhi]
MPHMPYSGQTQSVYELDAKEMEILHTCKQKVHSICSQHLHKPVRIQTVDGSTHEGIIVHVDHTFVYLQIPASHTRAFFPPYYPPFNPYYSNVVLPLALFNLLAIALLV